MVSPRNRNGGRDTIFLFDSHSRLMCLLLRKNAVELRRYGDINSPVTLFTEISWISRNYKPINSSALAENTSILVIKK